MFVQVENVYLSEDSGRKLQCTPILECIFLLFVGYIMYA